MGNAVKNNERIAKNTLFLYGRMLFVLLVSLYTTRVILTILGVEDFGIYNVVCGFVSMFSFLNTSMSNGIQRFYNYESGKGDINKVTEVYQTSCVIQLCLALLIIILLESIGIWYINNRMVIPHERVNAANFVFQSSVISLSMLIIQVPYSAAIMAHEKMNYYALVSIMDAILKLSIVLLLPFVSYDKLIIYGLCQVVISAFNFAMYFIYAKVKFKELYFHKHIIPIHKKLLKSISTFSGWNMLVMFAWMTQGQGVNLIINLFFGPLINAARGISVQIQSAIQVFCENILIAFRPQIVKTYAEGNISRTKRMMYSLSKLMFIMFFLLSTPLIFEINQILQLWLGDNVPEYASSFTILVLLSMYPRNFTTAFAQVVHATGKLKNYQIVSSVVVLLVLPLSYVALKNGAGVISVYWINFIICIIMFFACMCTFKKLFPFKILEYFKIVIIPCIIMGSISLIFPICITCLFRESLIRLIVNIVICTTIISILSYKIVLDTNEKNIIKNLILKR